MQIRKIAASDLAALNLVSATAFTYPFDPTAPMDWEEQARNHDTAPDSRSNRFWRERFCAFDEDSEMIASIHCVPYPMRFHGHPVTMSGVGGVVTIPEHRREGAIRECFAAALPEMKERGVLLSMLYPFSDSFYRQFGYEDFCRVNTWSIPLDCLPSVKTGGRIERFRAGGDYAPYAAVLEAMTARFDLCSVREPIDWKPFAGQNPTKQKQYTYLYRAADGTPKGYITYSGGEDEKHRSVLRCTPSFFNLQGFAFADSEGLVGLLSFVKSFAAYFERLELTLPESADISAVLTRHNTVEKRQAYGPQTRIVDVEQALRLTAYRGSGTLTLAVTDPCALWNEGVWQVSYRDGQAVTVEKREPSGSTVPDGELTIQDFTRLILGGFAPDDLWLLPEVKCADPDKLAGVFYRKTSFVTEMF